MKYLRIIWLSSVGAMGIGMVTIAPAVFAADVIVHIGVGEPAPAPVVYHYTYYPDAEVYYVPETRVYWWRGDGGVWVSGPALPERIVLGGGVRLNVDAPEPWHHHEVIIKRYPGRGHERREEKREEREERHEEHREEHHDKD